MNKELRLTGLVLGTIMLAWVFTLHTLAGVMGLSLVAVTSDLPNLYDEVIRECRNFAEHLWAAYGWPIWGVYTWLRSKS